MRLLALTVIWTYSMLAGAESFSPFAPVPLSVMGMLGIVGVSAMLDGFTRTQITDIVIAILLVTVFSGVLFVAFAVTPAVFLPVPVPLDLAVLQALQDAIPLLLYVFLTGTAFSTIGFLTRGAIM